MTGGTRVGSIRVTAFAPLAIVLLQSLLLAAPATRAAAAWMLRENAPVELLTFVAFLAAALLAARLAVLGRVPSQPEWAPVFHGSLALGLFVFAMEEIAWGQWLIGFETPAGFAAINRQGETTLHNLPLLHGKSEYVQLAFALGGLAATVWGQRGALRHVAPSRSVRPWLWVIAGHALADLFCDYVEVPRSIDAGLGLQSELIELFMGGVALAYVTTALSQRRAHLEPEPARRGTRDRDEEAS